MTVRKIVGIWLCSRAQLRAVSSPRLVRITIARMTALRAKVSPLGICFVPPLSMNDSTIPDPTPISASATASRHDRHPYVRIAGVRVATLMGEATSVAGEGCQHRIHRLDVLHFLH